MIQYDWSIGEIIEDIRIREANKVKMVKLGKQSKIGLWFYIMIMIMIIIKTIRSPTTDLFVVYKLK